MTYSIDNWLLPNLAGRKLLFVTLTCGRRVESPVLSAAVGELVRRIKRRVLGRKFEHRDLAQLTVLEPTFKGGVHAHLILEDPYSIRAAKAFECRVPIGRLITEEWCNLGVGGSAAAQDVQPVYDLAGAIGYLRKKTIGGASFYDRLDINNFRLPDRSAHLPIPNSHVPLDRDKQIK